MSLHITRSVRLRSRHVRPPFAVHSGMIEHHGPAQRQQSPGRDSCRGSDAGVPTIALPTWQDATATSMPPRIPPR
eukprot:2204250-Prymnesium_polylepis.3